MMQHCWVCVNPQGSKRTVLQYRTVLQEVPTDMDPLCSDSSLQTKWKPSWCLQLTKTSRIWSPFWKMQACIIMALSPLIKKDIPSDLGLSEGPRHSGLSPAGPWLWPAPARELHWREAAGHKGLIAFGEKYLSVGLPCESFCNIKGISRIKLFLKNTLEGVKSKSLFIFKVFHLRFLLLKSSVCFLFIYFRPVY